MSYTPSVRQPPSTDRVAGGPPAQGSLRLRRLLNGFAEPLIGIRTLFSNRRLLMTALVPVLWLAGFCALAALVEHRGDGKFGYLKNFYRTFSLLAPLPSLVFGRRYARLAAAAQRGFGRPCEPRLEPLPRAIKRALLQWVLVGSASPLLALIARSGRVGLALSAVLASVWALHWIVVEAFDSAQTLPLGVSLAEADRAALAEPPPWFVRGLRAGEALRVPVLSWLFGRAARFFDRLSLGWRGELQLLERDRLTCIGFGAATAVLLATPILNLFFRPVIIVAASRLLVQNTDAHERDPERWAAFSETINARTHPDVVLEAANRLAPKATPGSDRR